MSAELRTGEWFQTFLDGQFWPLDPRASEVYIEDIAHALSMQTRFAGHCKRFYSVAQHSVLVSENVPDEDAFWGLMHDASEAYLQDVISPLKRSGIMDGYRAVEQKVMAAIADRFVLALPEPDSVRIADKRMLATEKRDIRGPAPAQWNADHLAPPFDFKIVPWSQREAEWVFLSRFAELRR